MLGSRSTPALGGLAALDARSGPASYYPVNSRLGDFGAPLGPPRSKAMRYPRLDSTLGPHNSYVVDSAQPSFISYLLKFALLLCIATLVVVLVVGVLRFGIVEAFVGASSIC